MNTTAPMSFQEALDAREVKTLLPTTGRTADFAKLKSSIKERAMFSATVDSVDLLQKYDDLVNGILTGKVGEAEGRVQIKELLGDMGYEPDPEHRGGLQDLSSTPRINLALETNVDVARGYGWFTQGQDPLVLDAFPAQELVRFFATGKERDWAARWEKVGGQFFNGRMIALKSDPIWNKLGDPAIFPDGLGNPYAPFAFNSGMDVRDVSREEATSLGLIDSNTELMPQDRGLNADLQASPDVRSEKLRSLMEGTGLGAFDADGVFVFSGGKAA